MGKRKPPHNAHAYVLRNFRECEYIAGVGWCGPNWREARALQRVGEALDMFVDHLRAVHDGLFRDALFELVRSIDRASLGEVSRAEMNPE